MTIVHAASAQTTWTGDHASMSEKHGSVAREAASAGPGFGWSKPRRSNRYFTGAKRDDREIGNDPLARRSADPAEQAET